MAEMSEGTHLLTSVAAIYSYGSYIAIVEKFMS